jgi:hypothetical protein
MINSVSTVKQCGKVCAKCRIKFYTMRKTRDLYDNPTADANELQHPDSSHEVENANASDVAIEILVSLEAIRISSLRSSSSNKISIKIGGGGGGGGKKQN